MQDYLVRFLFHVDQRKRPELFPDVVYFDALYSVKNTDQLKRNVDQMSAAVLQQNFVVVPLDPVAIQEHRGQKIDKRMVVPLHMITHITTETTALAVPVPEFIDGKLQQIDGKEVFVQ